MGKSGFEMPGFEVSESVTAFAGAAFLSKFGVAGNENS